MPATFSRIFCLIALLLTFLMIVFIKGCHDDKSSLPTDSEQAGLALKIFADPETQAKLTGLTIDVVGLNDLGQPAVPQLPAISISGSNLPVTVPLTLYDPPCRYQVTVTANLTREAPRVASRVLDICQESRLTIKIDTFEGFWLPENPLHAAAAVNAGAAVDVACSTNELDAPDKAQYPLTATLSEQDGNAVSGPFDVNVAVAASFPDPYPLDAPVEQRQFTCEITDGRSAPQTFTLSVGRILATPTPTPTATPTPTPTAAPTPTPIIAPVPPIVPPVPPIVSTVPPTQSCVVTTANDSGAGSLRQILTDAACPTITFASGVTTITLAGTQLIVARNVTIDGGSGVTISGNNASRVFYVNPGVTAAFAGLTITGGRDSGNGGGILNEGTLLLESSTTISSNTASKNGGGIANTGTLTVNGSVSGNTTGTLSPYSNGDGGGIYNASGTLTVYGTISANKSYGFGGGISISSGILIMNGGVSNNLAFIDGGGIFSYGPAVTLSGTVRNNRADDSGGGISLSFGATLTLVTGHIIEGNLADTSGMRSGRGGGIDANSVACPTNANYGTGNYRNIYPNPTPVIDNCNGNP